MSTIYECCKIRSDVNNTPYPVHYAKTEYEAIKWLEDNGGGVYRNLLHKFSCDIKQINNHTA